MDNIKLTIDSGETKNKEEITKVSIENSIWVAIFLTLAGGFLDVFTFVGHGGVFANAMTGNFVFLAVHMANGNWQKTIPHLLPILAFLLGISVISCLKFPAVMKHLRRTTLICLGLEILVLLISIFLPDSFPDNLLVPCIAFVAAIQSACFNKIDDWSYSSVVPTGNLGQFAESIVNGINKVGNGDAFLEALKFGSLCIFYLFGAYIAALTTERFLNKALLFPIAFLFIALMICFNAKGLKNTVFHQK